MSIVYFLGCLQNFYYYIESSSPQILTPWPLLYAIKAKRLTDRTQRLCPYFSVKDDSEVPELFCKFSYLHLLPVHACQVPQFAATLIYGSYEVSSINYIQLLHWILSTISKLFGRLLCNSNNHQSANSYVIQYHLYLWQCHKIHLEFNLTILVQMDFQLYF